MAVLAPAELVRPVWDELCAAGLPAADPGELASGGLTSPLVVLAAGGANGLEFDIVVVVEPGMIAGETARGLRTLYVALDPAHPAADRRLRDAAAGRTHRGALSNGALSSGALSSGARQRRTEPAHGAAAAEFGGLAGSPSGAIPGGVAAPGRRAAGRARRDDVAGRRPIAADFPSWPPAKRID